MGNTRDFKENSEESLAMELLKDFKKQNKRQFVIILVLLLMFTCLLGYTIWLLNDKRIFDYRLKEYSITKMSMLENCSESTINREIKKIKRKISKVI